MPDPAVGFTVVIRENTLNKSRVFGIAISIVPYLFCINIRPMKLMMYLGNDLIEAVPVQPDKISQPGYLGQFKRQLKKRHEELLQQVPQPPDFLVINLVTQPARTSY